MFSGSNTVKQYAILLDNPSRSYFAGQVVTGRLILELTKERKTSGLKLNFLGQANVRWTESRNVTTGTGSNRRTRTETRTYSDQETYIDQKVYFVGASGGPELSLSPGYREFPFSFQLPLGIPSSFKGSYGHIQYSLSATLKKSWGFNKTTTTIFTVNGIVDLNTYPGAATPSEFTKQKNLGCLCCASGPISFVFKLNRMGFVPGEGLDFVVQMENQSSKPVRGIQIRLKRNVSFHARGKSRYQGDTVTGFAGPGVGAEETEIWRGNPNTSKIPAIPPTDLGGCRIIRVEYSIHVEMEIPSGFNLKGSTPLLIGTIPFRNNFEYMRPRFPEPAGFPTAPIEGFPAPSAPPFSIAGYPDLPPPSYEDAFGSAGLPTYDDATGGGDEGDGKEGNNKEGSAPAYDPNFVPKYATYGWSANPVPG